MSEMNPDVREALEESLYDLKHDLGKYIRLPVSMLPKDALWTEVTAQVEQGVLRTRKGPTGTISAAELLEKFHIEWGAMLADRPAYAAVQEAVAAACELPRHLGVPDERWTRDRVERILGAVSDTIQQLMDEVTHG